MLLLSLEIKEKQGLLKFLNPGGTELLED